MPEGDRPPPRHPLTLRVAAARLPDRASLGTSVAHCKEYRSAIGTDTSIPQQQQDARRRRRLFPNTGDTLADIAARELPGDDDGVAHLLSWNLHLSLRRQPVDEHSRLLGTDIVYLEPPLP